MFPQLQENDIEEIERKISSENIDYLEIAHYEVSEEEQKDPSSILVFQNKRVFYDIVDINQKQILVEKFKELSGETVLFVKARKITKSELQKRILALIEDEFTEDLLQEIEKDEFEDNEL